MSKQIFSLFGKRGDFTMQHLGGFMLALIVLVILLYFLLYFLFPGFAAKSNALYNEIAGIINPEAFQKVKFKPYEFQINEEEKIVENSINALICAINSVGKGKLDSSSEFCPGEHIVVTNAYPPYSGAPVAESLLKSKSKDPPQLKETKSTKSCSGVIYDSICIECAGTKPFTCVVKDFELPQNVDVYGVEFDEDIVKSNDDIDNFRDFWIGAYSDPEYIVYYESFPIGEEVAWQDDWGATTMQGFLYASVFNAGFEVVGVGFRLFKAIPKAGVKSVFASFFSKSGKEDAAVHAFRAYIKDLAQKKSGEQAIKNLGYTDVLTKAFGEVNQRTSKEIDNVVKALETGNFRGKSIDDFLDEFFNSNRKSLEDSKAFRTYSKRINTLRTKTDGELLPLLQLLKELPEEELEIIGKNAAQKIGRISQGSTSYTVSNVHIRTIINKEISDVDNLISNAIKEASKDQLSKNPAPILNRYILIKKNALKNLNKKGLKGYKAELERETAMTSFVRSFLDDGTVLRTADFNKVLKNTLKGVDELTSRQKNILLKDIDLDKVFKESINLKWYNRFFPRSVDEALITKAAKDLDGALDAFVKANSDEIVGANSKGFLNQVKNELKKKGVAKPLIIKYAGGYILSKALDSRMGVSNKFQNAGLNTLAISQPELIQPGIRKYGNLINKLESHFIALKKPDQDDSATGVTNPRFFLASPCKADLTISSGYCSCDVPKGSLIYNHADIRPSANMLDSSTIVENIFLYDSLSSEAKKNIRNECLKGSPPDWCVSGFYEPDIFDNLLDFLYDELYLPSTNFIKTEIENGNSISESEKCFDTDLGSSLLRVESFFKTFNVDGHIDDQKERMRDDPGYAALWVIAATSQFTLNELYPLFLDNREISDEGPPRCLLTKPVERAIFKENINQQILIEGISIRSALSDRLLEKIGAVRQNSGKNYYEDFVDKEFKENDPNNKKALLDKVTRDHYFNYFEIQNPRQEEVTKICNTLNINKALERIKVKQDVTGATLTMQCITVVPSLDSEYSPNYCFTGKMEGLGAVLSDVNFYGFIAFDIGISVVLTGSGVGTVALPFILAGTGAAHYAIEKAIIEDFKEWPNN